MPRTRSLIGLVGSLGTPRPLVVEVGVHVGQNTEGLLRAFPMLRMVLIDTWEAGRRAYVESGDEIARRDASHFDRARARACARILAHGGPPGRTTVLQAENLAVARCWEHLFPGQAPDLVFLDGEHTHGAVRAEIRAWWPLIAPGGILCGHDYDNPKYPEWGVKRAVDEWLGEAMNPPPSLVGVLPGMVWAVRKD